MTAGEAGTFICSCWYQLMEAFLQCVCWSRCIKMNDYYLQRRLLTNFTTKMFCRVCTKIFCWYLKVLTRETHR